MANQDEKKTRDIPPVWDLPLRLFHWGLVVALIGSIITGQNGFWFWHEKFGLAVLGLIGFRLIWGFVGGQHARFAHFRLSFREVRAYLAARRAGDRKHHPGHAPTGAWATLFMLALFATMPLLGTMSNNDVLFEGPLAAFVGDFSDTASTWHYRLKPVLIVTILAHLSAVLAYRVWLKISLLPAMITGGKDTTGAKTLSQGRQALGIGLLIASVSATEMLALLGERFYL